MELQIAKSQLEQQRGKMAGLRTHESELAGRQRLEQAKLDEIGHQLETLERELSTPPPTRP